jgi:hypothetical protein
MSEVEVGFQSLGPNQEYPVVPVVDVDYKIGDSWAARVACDLSLGEYVHELGYDVVDVNPDAIVRRAEALQADGQPTGSIDYTLFHPNSTQLDEAFGGDCALVGDSRLEIRVRASEYRLAKSEFLERRDNLETQIKAEEAVPQLDDEASEKLRADFIDLDRLNTAEEPFNTHELQHAVDRLNRVVQKVHDSAVLWHERKLKAFTLATGGPLCAAIGTVALSKGLEIGLQQNTPNLLMTGQEVGITGLAVGAIIGVINGIGRLTNKHDKKYRRLHTPSELRAYNAMKRKDLWKDDAIVTFR